MASGMPKNPGEPTPSVKHPLLPSSGTPGEGQGGGLGPRTEQGRLVEQAPPPRSSPGLPEEEVRDPANLESPIAAEPRNWTPAQKAAIRDQGRSLLVSAAAGSGKTAVLAERCAYLVCDAPEPCEVDELLVVTFTETAAAEMRGRIQAALAARVQSMDDPPPRLRRQIALVEHAQISTIHAFCARLLRQNFNRARIDPRFAIIDPDEAALLRRDICRELFDDRYERDADGQFAAFIDAYGDGRDESLIDLITHAHELLCSLQSPRKWMREAMQRNSDAAAKPLGDSELGRELLKAVGDELDSINRRCLSAISQIRSLGGFDGYLSRLREWSIVIADWIDVFHRRGLDALIQAWKQFDPPRLPAVKESAPGKTQAKALMDSLKKSMCEEKFSELLAFTEDQWREGQKTVAPYSAMFLGLVDEFATRYRQAKSRMNGLDFSDLEQKSLALLRDSNTQRLAPSLVARGCHRQYQHVLVDEYQDVNEIQDAILRLVSTECVAEEGHYPSNLFAVGDVKQSVFRFRLAEPRRFLERDRRFREKDSKLGHVIELRENFRSRPPLLEAINQVFSRLMTEEAAEIEYAGKHELRPPEKSGFPAADGQRRFDGAPIELHLLPWMRNAAEQESDEDSDLEQIEHEAVVAARRILQMTGNDGSPPTFIEQRPAHFGDIVVLMRSLKYKSDDFARILAEHGIPVHNTGGTGFFEATEIRDMLALLNVLDNQQQNVPLAAVLRSPLAQLSNPEESLAQIRLAYQNAYEEIVPFHQAVTRYAAEHDDDLAGKLRELLSRLSQWRDLARQRPLADLVWRIYEETAYLTFVAGQSGGSQRVANLLFLHRRARQFGSFLNQGLHRFMSFLSKLREETDLSQPSISDENQQAVRIMSIHKAKGLEFPIVVVPDLGKKHNLSDTHGGVLLDRRSGLGLRVVDLNRQIYYPSLGWTLTRESLRRQSLAEELRVLYVAMTRAKEHLILLGSIGDLAAQTWARNYAGRAGPLSADDILSANSMLDWLGPAQAAGGGKSIQLIQHAAEELQSASGAPMKRRGESTRRDLAELKPLSPAPTVDEKAVAVISRFEFVYPFESYTKLAAAISPTAMKPQFAGASSVAPVAESADLSAAQIGEATHLVLEHLDYRRSCDVSDIAAQIGELLHRRLLLDDQAASVDQEAIAWFCDSELGRLLKTNAAKLRREVPFALATPTSSQSPMDAVMIRGRLDLIVPTHAGVAVVDYKTDRVSPAEIQQRALTYQAQIEVYRQALQRIAGKKVSQVYLAFLHPRVIWKSDRQCP